MKEAVSCPSCRHFVAFVHKRDCAGGLSMKRKGLVLSFEELKALSPQAAYGTFVI